jgi:hypothetical protein
MDVHLTMKITKFGAGLHDQMNSNDTAENIRENGF